MLPQFVNIPTDLSSSPQDFLEKASALLDGHFRTADQARCERIQQQIIDLKTTPAPPSAPRSAPPVLIPSVVAKLAEALRGPLAIDLINRIGRVSNREMWRDVLIQLVTKIATKMESWVFDVDQRWLGIQLGKQAMSAGRNMWTLDRAGLIRYLHTGKRDEAKVGRPKMRIDLQPLIAELWESCANVTKEKTTQDKYFVTLGNDPGSPLDTNVHAVYSGTGKYADASMRTLYKFAIKRSGYTTVLARSLTASALTTLDYLVRNGEATRSELGEGAGMSPGAAAGGTRVLEQLCLVSVEWDGPGTAKIYILHPDWESRLQAIIPHMTSYGAGIRLRIRTFDDRIAFIDWKLKVEKSLPTIRELSDRKRKLERERRMWRAKGNQIGAFGRYVEMTPPWQGVGQ